MLFAERLCEGLRQGGVYYGMTAASEAITHTNNKDRVLEHIVDTNRDNWIKFQLAFSLFFLGR